MRLINVNSLKVGERLSNPIMMQDGRILLSANSVITDVYVKRLISFGIETVYISDELFDDVKVKPCLQNETKTMALNAIAGIFQQLSQNKPFNDGPIKHAMKAMVTDVRSSMREPISLYNTYAVSDKRCLHAVNVATIVAALAMESGCNMITTEDYTLAALLHDIKLDSLEHDFNPLHAEEAMLFLKNTHTFTARTYMSIAMHHERFDGMGFPKRLKGEDISEGARMIAIADMYDNLIHGYGSKKLNLVQAVEYVNMEAHKALDTKYIGIFNGAVAVFPTGSTVKLNNGYEAIVIEQNEKMPTRPKIRLRMPIKEECLSFNLLTQRTMFIEQLVL